MLILFSLKDSMALWFYLWRITTGFIQVRIEEPTPLIETLFQVIIFYFVMK